MTDFLASKRWHVAVGLGFPALYALLNAFYTLAQSGQIDLGNFGMGGSLLAGVALLLQAMASHRDDLRVQSQIVAPPVASQSAGDLIAQLEAYLAERKSVDGLLAAIVRTATLPSSPPTPLSASNATQIAEVSLPGSQPTKPPAAAPEPAPPA